MNVQEFYNQNPFPGPYSIGQLINYNVKNNAYVNLIDQYLTNNQKVLDVGCGTGLLTNLFALKYNSKFVGIDFSVGADYAREFAKTNNIANTKFIKQDFFEYKTLDKFDVIICQSVITHIPNYVDAVDKLKDLLAPNGILIVGVYNNWGNRVKKLMSVNYGNARLALDQTANPCEVVLTHKQVMRLFDDYRLDKISPSIANRLIGLTNLFNARNGGLTMYVFKGTENDNSSAS